MCVKRVNFKKTGNKDKEKNIEVKKRDIKAMYQAKCEAKRNRYADVSWRDNQKYKVLKIAKRRIKTNQYIIGKQIIIRNNESVLAVSH